MAKKVLVYTIALIAVVAVGIYSVRAYKSSQEVHKLKQTTNVGFMINASYHHLIGYKKACNNIGYELTNYGNIFNSLFHAELEAVEEQLAKEGTTLQTTWDRFDDELIEELDTNVADELNFMRKSLIVNKLAEMSSIPVRNIVWQDEMIDLIPLSDICKLFDENAEMVLRGNVALQNELHTQPISH